MSARGETTRSAGAPRMARGDPPSPGRGRRPDGAAKTPRLERLRVSFQRFWAMCGREGLEWEEWNRRLRRLPDRRDSDGARHGQDIPRRFVWLLVKVWKRSEAKKVQPRAIQEETQFLGEKVTHEMSFVGFG
jgi:hypothetical protein